jgi:excisionase family DNA binding protein
MMESEKNGSAERVLAPKWDGHSTFTAKEVAEIMQLSTLTVYEGIKAHQIPCVRIGRRCIIPRRALERLLSVA